jgi:hypothetical protein
MVRASDIAAFSVQKVMRLPFQGNAKVRAAIQVNEEFLTFFYCEYFPLGQKNPIAPASGISSIWHRVIGMVKHGFVCDSIEL